LKGKYKMKKHLPMNDETIAKATAIWKQIQEKICYLYERWQDEQLYEDWADYVNAAKAEVAVIGGCSFIGMTRRPFAVKIQMGEYQIACSVTQKAYKWKRIA